MLLICSCNLPNPPQNLYIFALPSPSYISMTACLLFLEFLENPCQVFCWCWVCLPPLCLPVGDTDLFLLAFIAQGPWSQLSDLVLDSKKVVWGGQNRGIQKPLSGLFSLCLKGHFYIPPDEIRVTEGTLGLSEHEVVSSDDWHQCFRNNPKQKAVGWSVSPALSSPYRENSSLLITRQGLKPSDLGIPVFLWQ